MVDLLIDIDVIENAINAFRSEVSDERVEAISALEKLLSEKQKLVLDFEEFAINS